LAAREPLDVAIGLFLLQGEATREEAEALLGAEAVEALAEAGILEVRGARGRARVAAAVSLYPCAGGLFATDHRWRPAGRADRRAPAEPVMYLGGDSYALAYLAPRRPVGAALDLCTGSGVHAVLAARHAERVVAVDLSPRALAFGRLNAAMNGVAEKIAWVRGDLFDALPAGERFDLVLANPPFVPTPHRGRARIAFRDAGATGEEVLARLVAGLPGRLARDGTAAIVSIFAELEGELYRARLERWLPRGSQLAGLLVRFGVDGPPDYAQGQTRRAYGDSLEEHRARLGRWVETLRRARVARLSGGILALRAHGGPTPPWFRALDVPWPAHALPDELERAWRSCDAAQSVVFAEDLLDRAARVPDDLVLVTEAERPSPGAPPVPARHRARRAGGLGPEVGLSRELHGLLAVCDGATPLRRELQKLAEAFDADAAALADQLLPDLLELVARGLLALEKT
ncbi:MAG TPA: methyltransferase, partial [Planctomycetota bacterium]|nr:methyltransferase [Planctomycetota bacterium]